MWSLHLQGFWQHSLQWDHQREEKLAEIKKEYFCSWLTKCLTNIQSSLEAINTITQNKSRKVQSKPENKICSMCWYLENRPNEKKKYIYEDEGEFIKCLRQASRQVCAMLLRFCEQGGKNLS